MGIGSVRRLVTSIRPLAWSLLALAVVCLLVAEWLDSAPLVTIGACLALVVLSALVVVLLPSRAQVRIQLRPTRAQVGGTAVCEVWVRNAGIVPMTQAAVELPGVGESHRRTLAMRGRRTETATTFVIGALWRGVHRIGPARAYQQDPFGLVRRQRGASGAVDFYVRPRIIDVENLGVGQSSDLEGVVTDEISMSDLSFHALREYVPGDDLRHVHWRSSAKADRLLVRQYHDTRRSQLTVIVDTGSGSYRSSAEFELALSLAASLASRAATDDLELSFHCGEEHLVNTSPDEALNATCRAERGSDSVAALVARARAEMDGSAGLVVVISGGLSDDGPARAAVASFGGTGRVLLLRADGQAEPRLRTVGEATVGDLAELEQFPAVMEQFLWGNG